MTRGRLNLYFNALRNQNENVQRNLGPESSEGETPYRVPGIRDELSVTFSILILKIRTRKITLNYPLLGYDDQYSL